MAGSIQLTKVKTATKKAAKAMKVKFTRLSLTAVKTVNTRRNQHAIASLQDQSSAPRSLGARQVRVAERLGDYTKAYVPPGKHRYRRPINLRSQSI